MGPREIELVRIANIQVGERFRKPSPESVDRLARSISEIGLQTPIHVRYVEEMEIDGKPACNMPVLVAGATRLAAVKQLGWEKIEAIALADNDIEAQLWEIDENLARAELTPAQIAEHTARRKELWEAKETATICRSFDGRGNTGFASETAKATGKNVRDIQRAARRGEKIAPDVLRDVQGTELDKGTALDALAKLPHDEQRRAVQTRQLPISTGVEKRPGVEANESRLKAAQNAYNKLDDDERRLFLEWLEETEPAIFDATPSGRAA